MYTPAMNVLPPKIVPDSTENCAELRLLLSKESYLLPFDWFMVNIQYIQ